MLLFLVVVPIIGIFFTFISSSFGSDDLSTNRSVGLIIGIFFTFIRIFYTIVDFFYYINSIITTFLLTPQGFRILLVFGFFTPDDDFSFYFKCLFLLYFVHCLYEYVLNSKILDNHLIIKMLLLEGLIVVRLLLLGILIDIIISTVISFFKLVLSYIVKMNNSSYPKNDNPNKDSNDHFNNNGKGPNNNNGKGPNNNNNSHPVMKSDNKDSDSDSDPNSRIVGRTSLWYMRKTTESQNGSGHQTFFDQNDRILRRLYFEEKLVNGLPKKSPTKIDCYDIRGVLVKSIRLDENGKVGVVFSYDGSGYGSFPKPTFLF